jgi:hypothetical protein
MKRPNINLFHIKSVEELEEWQRYLRSLPGAGEYTGEDLSEKGLHKKFEAGHVVVGRNVPCPFEDPVPVGSTVYTDWNGVPAWWLNGTLYVRKDRYERYKREHPEEE